MQNPREVRGVITWKSIGRQKALGRDCNRVGDCREDAQIVDANRILFEAIPAIVEHGYVLVRGRDKRITGIVTAADLSLKFQDLAGPFLLLREIELHLRRFLEGNVTTDEIRSLGAGDRGNQNPQKITELSFGELVRLLQNATIWGRVGLKIDFGVFMRLLEAVRLIRNDIMHFDPDPRTDVELRTLRQAIVLLRELSENPVRVAVAN